MFAAEFDDGPMQGAQHVFLGASEPYPDLYAMPSISNRRPWVIVGYTGLVPDPPWPGQVHYVLIFTELLAELVGHYTMKGEG